MPITYVLSTSLYTFAQVEQGFFGWPTDTGEAEIIRNLRPGDVIIPKFSAAPVYGEGDALESARRYLESIDVDYEGVRARYAAEVASGDRAVPYLIKVVDQRPDDSRSPGPPWACVGVETVALQHPLSAREFLLLRALPEAIAAQIKGTVSSGRHLQEVPQETLQAVQIAASSAIRAQTLRQFSVVRAQTAESAATILENAGRSRIPGDRAFVAAPGGLLGVHDVSSDGLLVPVGQPIPKTPDQLLDLFQAAQDASTSADSFAPQRAILAARELQELMVSPEPLIEVDDFGKFHDRYALLARKVTQALEIVQRPRPSTDGTLSSESPEEDDAQVDELAALKGLTTDSVRRELPDGMILPDSVLAEAVTSLRAGKHLLLGGPPGTGKTTLAEALCRAVVVTQYEVTTGTADWTTFDTIGGYMPTRDEGLRFEPGIVLRCLKAGRWLVIDELNRADIDKAFGPLFTLLAGGELDSPSRRVVLPFQADGASVEIRWAEKRTSAVPYSLTPAWRLIGTLNLADKASLFKLSFAFLRRFAVVDVPLPPPADYKTFFESLCTELPDAERANIVAVGMSLAFGPRQLGPAILKDIATFVRIGLTETATGQPTYNDPVTAFVAAFRLFGLPQYEGSTSAETATVLKSLRDVWPERPAEDWTVLREALDALALQ